MLVSKVLRSLPERFNIKICAIDEANDTTLIALEDLISSLRTFEMNMDMQKKDKSKTIAFHVSNESYTDQLQLSQEVNESDLCEDSISYITKKFGDYLKRNRDKKKTEQSSRFPSLLAPERPQKSHVQNQYRPRNEGKSQPNPKKYDSVQCRECSGFGHYANECANRTRKNRGYNVNPFGVATPGGNTCSKSVCLKSTTSGNSSTYDDLEVDDEEIILESVQKLYEKLYYDWIKRNKLNLTLMKEKIELKAVVVKLEVILSKKDLELGKTNDELQKRRDDKKGLGFKESVFEIGESSKSTVFVKGKDDYSKQPQSTPSNKSPPPKRQHAAPISKQRKHSGSSRYMTGSREHHIDYVEQKGGRVTYGRGTKGKIVGKRTLNVEVLPKLHNVLHVEGLNSNLIRISHTFVAIVKRKKNLKTLHSHLFEP
ncbi:uncharacterized protein [Primulina huaijiensis]|uniref:uncharacterized protein n=1 Tax=Primulina huaijiensis TaxID=1492673 RepID=UPI003CC76AD6